MSDSFDKARDGDEKKSNGEQKQFLTFTIEAEEYAVDIMLVREIKGWIETTRLPNSPDFMRGVINLRGLIIPIFDLRARFKGEITVGTEAHVFIILAVGTRNIGILVDAVSDILTVDTENVKPAPDIDPSNGAADFISGLISLEGRMVVLLAIDKLFGSEIAAASQLLPPPQAA